MSLGTMVFLEGKQVFLIRRERVVIHKKWQRYAHKM